MKTSRLLALLLTIFLLVPSVLTQAPPDRSVEKDQFLAGEKLTYVGKLKKLGIFSFSLAELEFLVNGKDADGNYSITSSGRSKGSLVSLFNFKFFLKIDTSVDAEKLQVIKSVKRDEQGDRIRDSVADFDYDESRVLWIESDPNTPTKAPRRVTSTITTDTHDIVSAVYRLRGMDLAVGKRFVFNVSDSGLVYEVPVDITEREEIKSDLGKRWCFKIEPQIFGPDRIIDQKGKLTIWITDDVDRVPVRAELETELGDVTIKLKDHENIRSSRVTP